MDERLAIEKIVKDYRADVDKLSRYLGWLHDKSGAKVMDTYRGDGQNKLSMTVPVYDSTLLLFIKEVQKTCFINRNYAYVYVRYHMKTEEDELRMIARATISDMELLGGILSKYVLKGMTKGVVWQEGVKNGVLEATVAKMKELLDFWE